MTRIRIKRVYEAPAPDDGCRVLVDRLWPRGVRRDALHCDVWARDLAPSAGLRSWYHADPGDRWEEFRRRYTDELRASQAVRVRITSASALRTSAAEIAVAGRYSTSANGSRTPRRKGMALSAMIFMVTGVFFVFRL